MEKARHYKRWTEEELEFLSNHFGTMTYEKMSEKLGRTVNSIKYRVVEMKLGKFWDNGDYVTLRQLFLAVTGRVLGGGDRKVLTSLKFPIRRKRIVNCSINVVYLEQFWNWVEENPNSISFARFEKNALGKEPEWADEKRKRDIERAKKYKTTPWTQYEDNRLKFLVQNRNMTIDELANEFSRTTCAIKKRLQVIGVKARPEYTAPIKWTQEEYDLMDKLIDDGCIDIHQLVDNMPGRNQITISKSLYRRYKTQNIGKIREIRKCIKNDTSTKI